MTKHYLAAAALAAGVLLTAATGALGAETKGKAASIEGVWKVTHVEITGANPLTVAKPLANLTIFGRGHYANVGDQGEQPRTAAPAFKTPGKPTDAEKLAKYDEWAPVGAQAGTYELKGHKLTRTPIVAKNVGAVTAGAYVSDVKMLSATTLVLVTQAPSGQPAREQTVTLTRVK
jgi:hypothetical protein